MEINDVVIVKFLDSIVEIARLESESQAIQAEKDADTKQVGLQTSGLMSVLSFIGTLITANLKKTAENTSSGIMPMLLGMMMGNNGFSPSKTDTSSAAKDSEKPTPEPENSENSEE